MKKVLVLLIVSVILTLNISASAESAADIIGGKQDFVILGSVKDIEKDVMEITVDYVLNNPQSELIGTDIKVNKFSYSYCSDHAPEEFSSPKVSDNIVLSIDKKSDKYTMKNGSYKVDSNEYANCKIIMHEDSKDEDCVEELLELTCYIRSNAKVKEFEFDDEGRIYAVYPQTVEQCVYFVDDSGSAISDIEEAEALPTVPQAAPDGQLPGKKDNRWIFAIVMLLCGSVLGVAVSYIRIIKKND